MWDLIDLLVHITTAYAIKYMETSLLFTGIKRALV